MLDDVTTKRLIVSTLLFLVIGFAMILVPLYATDYPLTWMSMNIVMVIITGVCIGELLFRWKQVYTEHKKLRESNNPVLKKV